MVGINAVSGVYCEGDGAIAAPICGAMYWGALYWDALYWGAMYWGANAVENCPLQVLHPLAAWNAIGGGAQAVVIGIVSVTCWTVCTGTNCVVNCGTRRVT